MFFLLYSINWPNFVVWFSFLQFWTICVLQFCFPGCHIINLEINLIFLIRSFFCMTKTWCLKIKYLEDKRAFKVKDKTFFITFKGLSFAKNCLRPWIWLFICCKTKFFLYKTKKNFFLKKYVLYKIYIICRKKNFIWKESFILKNFLLKKTFFSDKNLSENVKNYI